MRKIKVRLLVILVALVAAFNLKTGFISDRLFLDESRITTAAAVKKDSDYIDISGNKNIKSKNVIAVKTGKKNNRIVLGKNINEKINPASMTKIMTVITAIENCNNINRRVTITNDIVNYCHNNGLSVSGFEAGDRPKIKDLLYGALLESGGESCIALSRNICDTEEEFIEKMNEKAKELKMKNSHFENVTGMTMKNHYSSVKDIALLLDYAMKNKKFEEVITAKKYTAKNYNKPFSKHEIVNALFYKRNAMNIKSDYIEAGKTGYTKAAGLCLASKGNLNGENYIIVTAGAKGDSTTEQFNLTDTVKIYKIIEKRKQE